MYVLIDNYDSFTYNLYHAFAATGAAVQVYRNDAITVEAVLALQPEGIVLSPGPCDPDRAGICLALIKAASGRIPILGVCLGHQSIGQAFGGRVVRAPKPMHGKVSRIEHDGRGLFAGLSNPFLATRYHSLMVEPSVLPACLAVTASSEDGVIQGLQHTSHPTYGVQFHPESIETPEGGALISNFLALAAGHGRGAGDGERQH